MPGLVVPGVVVVPVSRPGVVVCATMFGAVSAKLNDDSSKQAAAHGI